MNELESAMETSGDDDISYPSDVIDRIRLLYKTREGRVPRVPWCEGFSFHLDEIFTRLRIINKEKTRGILCEEITNMTAIFKTHEGCRRPRTVLIEGDPGMGKTTYCQKLAYDWANRREKWDESFPEIEVLLLLRCHDIETNILEAIDEQILPEDVDKESKEIFFKFIRENQSKVLLVLDGLDEVDPSKLPMYLKLAESRAFSECHIVFTCRHEAGVKFRQPCDTLWELVGFTQQDAKTFIIKYFKNDEPLAEKLLEQLYPFTSEPTGLGEMMSNPLNTALLCVLCEDFEGNFPTNRTQLYIEIVRCVLRRYEKKNDLSTNSENLLNVYEEELTQLGHMAFKSLCEGDLYIDESECGCRSNVVTKFGFLSVQAAGSRRKSCVRYGFLHKSFQEFFSGFFLASKFLNGTLDWDAVTTDERLKHAILFMSGIVVSHGEETAVCLAKSLATHVNSSKRELFRNLQFAFDCFKECATHKKHLQSQLLRTFGSQLDIQYVKLEDNLKGYFEYFCETLTTNAVLTHLDLYMSYIGDSGAGFLSLAIKVNTVLTHLNLGWNTIGASGAGFLSDAIKVNTVLTNLDLSENGIGDAGAGFLSNAIKVNTVLTNLDLSHIFIGASGAGFLSDAIKVNTVLTNLDISDNRIGDCGACFLSDAIKVNTVLANLDLSRNDIGASGAGFLSDAIKVNTVLTNLNLNGNDIGASGAGFLSDAIKVNTVLTNLGLSYNKIGDSGAGFLSDAIKVNTVLTNLYLCLNGIGDSGAGFLSDAIKVNTVLTNLDLGWNRIGDSGAGFFSDAIKVNTVLTNLELNHNEIGDSGAGFLSDAIKVNTVLTNLKLNHNEIGDSGFGFLSDAIKVNTVLTIKFGIQW